MDWPWKTILIVIIGLAYGLFGKIEGQYGQFIKPSWMRRKDKKLTKKDKH